uniref:Uncharacterized protein n=1 Tax=Anguilla anguilla TaxID=7936 RepID=A0A0E9RNY6_ANGAN
MASLSHVQLFDHVILSKNSVLQSCLIAVN